MDNYALYFDGACAPKNPGGTASYGYTLQKNGIFLNEGYGVVGSGPKMSNNVAEFHALYQGLKYFLYVAPKSGDKLEIFGDSTLVVKQISHKWRAWSTGLYWPEYVKAAKLINSLIPEYGVEWTIAWIPREQNERCDALSKAPFTRSESKVKRRRATVRVRSADQRLRTALDDQFLAALEKDD